MKVVVDFDTCQSNAICMGICPEVFEVREDGFLYVLDEHPPESLRAKVEEAAQLCPTQSISIEED
jgi:ferredoxin